jgi:hypothetical protein
MVCHLCNFTVGMQCQDAAAAAAVVVHAFNFGAAPSLSPLLLHHRCSSITVAAAAPQWFVLQG